MERAKAYIETANAAIKLALSAIALVVVVMLITVPVKELENNTFGKIIRNFAILLKFDITNMMAITNSGTQSSQKLGDAIAATASNNTPPEARKALDNVNDATVSSATQAQNAGVPAPLAGSGVVFGADRSLAAARDELQAAHSSGLTAALYQRQGFYRSVALVGTAESARQALDTLRSKYPERAPYLVDLQKWCPVSRSEQQEGVSVTICN